MQYQLTYLRFYVAEEKKILVYLLGGENNFKTITENAEYSVDQQNYTEYCQISAQLLAQKTGTYHLVPKATSLWHLSEFIPFSLRCLPSRRHMDSVCETLLIISSNLEEQ